MRCSRVDRGHGTLLYIEGTLDAIDAPKLRGTIDELVADRRQLVIIDLSSLRVIDSSGIGALISLYKQLRAQGGEMRVVGVRGQPLAIFQLLRLDAFFCRAGSPPDQIERAS